MTVCGFINDCGAFPLDIVVPVPPSRSERAICPSVEVARLVARTLGLAFSSDGVIKAKRTKELKNVFDRAERLKLLEDAFEVPKPELITDKRVLLLDDLYRSGVTMNAVANALSQHGHAKKIFALALTKTRSLR